MPKILATSQTAQQTLPISTPAPAVVRFTFSQAGQAPVPPVTVPWSADAASYSATSPSLPTYGVWTVTVQAVDASGAAVGAAVTGTIDLGPATITYRVVSGTLVLQAVSTP